MTIPEALFDTALETMRECGQGHNECVAYLVEDQTGALNLVHPKHRAHGGGYEIDQDWLGRFAVRQSIEGLNVVAQLHTHPGRAFHSAVDDQWPMVGVAGFVSIVVPRFAQHPIQPEEIYACQLGVDGLWSSLDPTTLIAQ